MEKYIINGGNRLEGKVEVSSSKNAVLPMIAASILTKEQVVIKNCPQILDVKNMLEILNFIGAKTSFNDNNLVVSSKNVESVYINENLTEKLRSSIYLLGALLCRFKKIRIAYPGGCKIGKRPIDIHLNCLRALGVNCIEEDGSVSCSIDKKEGGECALCFPSVGATENLILFSVICKGITTIHNCAKEPEIIDLCKMLNLMGAKIYGAGTKTIRIEGVKKLNGIEFLPMKDRIETGTFVLAVAINGGNLEINGCNRENISPLLDKICKTTCKVGIKNDIINIKSGVMQNSISFTTGPYPLFPTDLMAQTLVLATILNGRSYIRENIFEDRFQFVKWLIKMGAKINIKGNLAIVEGVKALSGCPVYAEDLRGGAALVLAGLVSKGQTEVNGIKHIERGYENFTEKLLAIGADIKRTKDR